MLNPSVFTSCRLFSAGEGERSTVGVWRRSSHSPLREVGRTVTVSGTLRVFKHGKAKTLIGAYTVKSTPLTDSPRFQEAVSLSKPLSSGTSLCRWNLPRTRAAWRWGVAGTEIDAGVSDCPPRAKKKKKCNKISQFGQFSRSGDIEG